MTDKKLKLDKMINDFKDVGFKEHSCNEQN